MVLEVEGSSPSSHPMIFQGSGVFLGAFFVASIGKRAAQAPTFPAQWSSVPGLRRFFLS